MSYMLELLVTTRGQGVRSRPPRKHVTSKPSMSKYDRTRSPRYSFDCIGQCRPSPQPYPSPYVPAAYVPVRPPCVPPPSVQVSVTGGRQAAFFYVNLRSASGCNVRSCLFRSPEATVRYGSTNSSDRLPTHCSQVGC